jgi:N-acetylglucosamine kinase-like BadF-type ATPase
MAFYLGIDSGGTKTRCAVADDHGVLATAVSGGSNVVRLGETVAREALHSAIHQACSTAKIAPQLIQSVCVGSAGGARPEIAARIRAMLLEVGSGFAPDRVEIVGDSVIALEAAFGAEPGVIAISGTGSMMYGRDAGGHTVRAGGWGFAVSDEGSGHWIGRHAVTGLLHARDRNQETKLTALVLDAWKLHNMDELIRHANSTPPPEFPQLFPIVLRTAEAGDLIAHELLTRAGRELAALAAIVITQIAPSSPYVPVAMVGSVFRQSAEVRSVFYNELQASFPGIELRQDFVEPVLGAVALARSTGPTSAR